jgi:hypothetical protein
MKLRLRTLHLYSVRRIVTERIIPALGNTDTTDRGCLARSGAGEQAAGIWEQPCKRWRRCELRENQGARWTSQLR